MSTKEEFLDTAIQAILDHPSATIPSVTDFSSTSPEDVIDATAIAIRVVDAIFTSPAMQKRDIRLMHDSWDRGRITGLADFKSAHDTPNPYPVEES